ncbi:methyltransferase domain-containing protein [Aquimarina sp. AU474]|uniref:methyltransferase domain-containing protein n=1 Tax=Aquimarina sp. AU474 TaxID=2108529 RepID=UPI000D69EFE3|nr:methyltransferase domain-containing protein [Aquimarina sp. AU474]
MNPRVRLRTSEKLDDLSLSGEPLTHTLSSLKWINSVLGNHTQLSNAVVQYCKKNKNKKRIHIVDLGCGGGDCIFYISKKLKQKDVEVSFTGIDGNPSSILFASEKIPHSQNINFVVADILDKNFKIPDCDLLISSHFIYHFDNEGLVDFLKKTQRKKIKHIIFSELYRSRMAYYLFKNMSYLLPISNMAKKDGLTAIQRAFSINELREIIKQSSSKKFKINKKPFFRMVAKIEP